MRKDDIGFVRFVVDRIPTPVLEECIKTILQGGVDRERNFLRALLELHQDMPLLIPSKESNDMESYRGVGGNEKILQQGVESEPRVN